MKLIRLQCTSLQTAAYLTVALRASFAHNPGMVFALTCRSEWHADLKQFCDDPRLEFTGHNYRENIHLDINMDKERPIFQSVPALFITVFRLVAEQQGFTSGVDSELDLIFPLNMRYVGTARILFINASNTVFHADQLDTLIQSIGDKRLSIITTSPTRAGNSSWQDGRTLAEYANIAASADYVVGAAGAHMAVAFNQGSINRCQGWIVLDPRARYPFNDRCWSASTWGDAVARLRQEGLV